MSSIHVVYTPLDIKPEQARDATALALRFVLDCYAKKQAAHPDSPDDAAEGFRISENEKGGRRVEH